jgi:hypothetical protein
MPEFKERLLAFAVAAAMTLGLLVIEDFDEDVELASTSKPALPFNQTATFNSCGQAGASCR